MGRVRRGRCRLACPGRDILACLMDRLRRGYVRVPARAKDAVPVLVAGGAAAIGAAALALSGAGAIGARVSSLFSGEARPELYDFRLDLVERAARIVADHPLTGLGDFEEVGVYAGRPDIATHPHNLLLGLAVFFGIPAALAFAGLVLLAFMGVWAGYRSAGPLDGARVPRAARRVPRRRAPRVPVLEHAAHRSWCSLSQSVSPSNDRTSWADHRRRDPRSSPPICQPVSFAWKAVTGQQARIGGGRR